MLILLIALVVLIGAYAVRDTLRGYWSLLAQLPSSNADFDCFRIREAAQPLLSAGAPHAASRLASTAATTAAHAA